ncbi:hypothetical protein [Streptomyces sp. SID3343]|uniref:hypothetical protein n=1 Tax=Streptomyces sp. SID3343 TaxID=2690260 RepID=UPI00136F929D|nr:hypothetical protein [Streptomyces sp. SID3343]MYW00929.1 hypothetical protein [Streptomyces sp. SID3343]
MTAHPFAPLTLLNEETDVLALAGAGPADYRVGGAGVVFGAAATVVIADSHDDPHESGVRDSRTFELIDVAPVRFVDRLYQLREPMLLFVRVPDGVLYLGQGDLRSWGAGPERGFEAALSIRPPLSESVLDRVRPPRPVAPPPGVDWLDAVPVDPTAALADFVTGWYPKTSGVPASHASTATELPVPPPLAHFHRLAAERPQILGVQNFVEPWEELARHAGGPLRIAVENQGGYDWRVDPSEPDPAVWLHHDRFTPPEREREPLSGWLLQFSLAEAAIGGPYRAIVGEPPAPLVDDLTRTLRRVPLRSYWWSFSPTSFHVAPGLVVEVGGETGGDTYDSVVVAATHRALLKPLADLGIEWLGFDG